MRSNGSSKVQRRELGCDAAATEAVAVYGYFKSFTLVTSHWRQLPQGRGLFPGARQHPAAKSNSQTEIQGESQQSPGSTLEEVWVLRCTSPQSALAPLPYTWATEEAQETLVHPHWPSLPQLVSRCK